MKFPTIGFVCLLALSTPRIAFAQLTMANDAPIVYGHHHINVSNLDAHKKFWADTLGGKATKLGSSPLNVMVFPNVLVLLNERAPTGGTKGTTVNHVAFAVPNLRATVDKIKAAGYALVTNAEVGSSIQVKDDLAFLADQNTYVAYTMGPDATKVEFVENKSMIGPIALDHVHFAAPNGEEMRAWYVKTFNVKPSKQGSTQIATLPGVKLTFSSDAEPVVTTRGRSIDHIGFEVDGLENFCKQLEASGVKLDRPYTKLPALGVAIAYLTDPWGTYIELTEGMDEVR